MSGGERLFSGTCDIKMPCYGKKYGVYDKCVDCLFGYWCRKIMLMTGELLDATILLDKVLGDGPE